MVLFHADITSWTDWGHVFQDKEAFAPLCMAILEKEGLPKLPLSSLTPGTNAVFRTGEVVLKVFYPPESGLDSLYDWETEKRVLEFAAQEGVSAPKLLAAGEIQDKYLFRYLIIEFCEGEEAGELLTKLKPEEKPAFAEAVRALLARMNQPAEGLIAQKDLARQALENPRFEGLHPGLRADFRAMAEKYGALDKKTLPPFFKPVLVHGDCTGENLLAQKDGDGFALRLIDFADCCMAPSWYELPPVVFELFHEDPQLVRAYIGETDFAEFLEKLVWGLALHDFGGDILKGFFARQKISPDSVDSAAALRWLLAEHFLDFSDLQPFFPNTHFPEPSGDLIRDAEAFFQQNGQERRLARAQGTADTAASLAKGMNLDEELCRTAALLQNLDYALPAKELAACADAFGLPVYEGERARPSPLLYQRFAALLARCWLRVTDPDILAAIRTHKTLQPNPSPYQLILFLANKLSLSQMGYTFFEEPIKRGIVHSLEAAALICISDSLLNSVLLTPVHPQLLASLDSLAEKVLPSLPGEPPAALFTAETFTAAFSLTHFLPASGDYLADAEKLYIKNGKEKTFAHVQAVAETAEQLAERFGLDKKRCQAAAILHDLAAVLPKEEMLAWAQKWEMPLCEAERRYPMLLHQRFSAILARYALHVADGEVLSAIQVHTTLKANPSPYDLVIFLADKISWDQEGQPPYLALIEEGLNISLKAAAFRYLDDALNNGRLLLPHQWLLEAYHSLS